MTQPQPCPARGRRRRLALRDAGSVLGELAGGRTLSFPSPLPAGSWGAPWADTTARPGPKDGKGAQPGSDLGLGVWELGREEGRCLYARSSPCHIPWGAPQGAATAQPSPKSHAAAAGSPQPEQGTRAAAWAGQEGAAREAPPLRAAGTQAPAGGREDPGAAGWPRSSAPGRAGKGRPGAAPQYLTQQLPAGAGGSGSGNLRHAESAGGHRGRGRIGSHLCKGQAVPFPPRPMFSSRAGAPCP